MFHDTYTGDHRRGDEYSDDEPANLRAVTESRGHHQKDRHPREEVQKSLPPVHGTRDTHHAPE